MEELRSILQRIEGRGYGAYKDIAGRYAGEDFALEVVHVQGDPFASPSRLAVHIPAEALPLDGLGVEVASRRIGVEDALLRSFAAAVAESRARRGSGRSGQWGVARLGQEILARTGCEIDRRGAVLRFTAGLPADGRRVLGRQAWAMLGEELPALVERGVLEADFGALKASADANEDQEALRAQVVERGWVAFLAEGSLLPRRSGVDDRPMAGGAVPWVVPPELRQVVRLPNKGEVVGAALESGVTLICGGGYHGKSTLLETLERGIYNHIPGDGRELCATTPGAVTVRAEDGRAVTGVDIAAFIGELPGGRSTRAFSTEDASGSTSQAASIAEALELGATALLIDEDTSATNFMVRDRRMQALIATEDEPIAPLVDRVRELRDRLGVSCVLVLGGSGDYFDVADAVLALKGYVPRVVTAQARAIAASHPTGRLQEARAPLAAPRARVVLPAGLDPTGHRGDRARVQARRTDAIAYGEGEIDLRALSQLVDEGQARALGDLLVYASRELVDGARTLQEVCAALEAALASRPLSSFGPPGSGDRARVRGLEVCAAINRLRGLRVKPRSG